MRAHDVGIGLAVAWARRRGLLISEARSTLGVDDDVCFLVFNDFSVHVRTHYWWCRGPVVEPEPLTDTRIAFGIAMAQENRRRGWYSFVPLQQFRMRDDWYESGGRAYHSGAKWGAGIVDLDPRRWAR